MGLYVGFHITLDLKTLSQKAANKIREVFCFEDEKYTYTTLPMVLQICFLMEFVMTNIAKKLVSMC
jgi:hypothetical protein